MQDILNRITAEKFIYIFYYRKISAQKSNFIVGFSNG